MRDASMRDDHDRDSQVTRPVPEGSAPRLRPLTLMLLTLLLLLLGAAILPAHWVLAAPGDGYGPGTCGGDTTRTCEATDSVLGAGIASLAAAIGTPDSAVPTKVVMAGSKAVAVGGVFGTVTAGDAVTPKATLQGVQMAHLVQADGSASLGAAGAAPLYTSTVVTAAPAVTGAVTVEGTVAEGAAASGEDPVAVGIEARALGALPAAVDAGDVARARGSLNGVLYSTLTEPGGTTDVGSAISGYLASIIETATVVSARVNLIRGQNGVAGGAGASDATTLRAVLANDGIGSATLPAVTKVTSWAGAPCVDVNVAAANTVVLASSTTRQYVQVCNNDPTMDDNALVNVGAASAGGARLNKPLVAGDRGDCQPFPPGAALVGQSAGAAATVTLSVCAW